ncbi:MAG: hypothetical protein ABIG44_18325 [Planctomycetota bacterium]
MTRVLFLAWRYVTYHKIKTTILTACLTLTIVLPLTASWLVAVYGRALLSRAQATPLVVGARGNRFDLVLKTLYFGSAHVDPLHMSAVEGLRDDPDELAQPIPLHLGFTARGYPIVGTTLAYFDFRGLTVAWGTKPLQLGQAVLGSVIAADLQLGPGDALFSDQRALYDITRTYPLKMHVVGVLADTNTPDDRAVFVDIKTAWIIAGLAHGHQDVVESADDSQILRRGEDNVVASSGIVEYNEVTPANIGSFHIHAQPEDLPLSAIIVLPASEKAATMLKARYNLSTTERMLVPTDVINELLGLVFRVKRFFDANFALIAVSTVLFIVLVVLLSLRIRQREMETMFKIGCGRLMACWLQIAELAIVLVLSIVLAGSLALLARLAAPRLMHLL